MTSCIGNISNKTEAKRTVDANTSTEQGERKHDAQRENRSTYDIFFWLLGYFKMSTTRFVKDLLVSLIRYWFPDQMVLPPHIVHLMSVQARMRAERELHAVTYIRTRNVQRYSRGSLRNDVPSGQDGTDLLLRPHNQNLIIGNDNETNFIILNKNGIDTSLHNQLNDFRFMKKNRHITSKTNFKNNPDEAPSTSTITNYGLPKLMDESDSANELEIINVNLDRRESLSINNNDSSSLMLNYLKTNNMNSGTEINNRVPLLIDDRDSANELQMININLESENSILLGDNSDNRSIMVTYLKNKNSIEPVDRQLPTTLHIIMAENEQRSEENISEDSLDVYIPSYPGSPKFLEYNADYSSSSSSEESLPEIYAAAIDILQEENDFLIAVKIGDYKRVKQYISENKDINVLDSIGRNALHAAVTSGNLDIVKTLLKAGIDPNVQDNIGMTPLTICLMRRPSRVMVDTLMKHGAIMVPRSGETDTGLFLQFVMMCIPTLEEEKILRILVARGALINDPEAPGGRQAIHFAAMSDNCRLLKILIELGADLTVKNHRNETPKELALTFKSKKAFAFLDAIEHGLTAIIPDDPSHDIIIIIDEILNRIKYE